MAYIDKDDARDLVKKHWSFFENSIKNGDDYTIPIKESVGWLYLILLSIRCITIGGIWLLLSYLDPFLGTGFLLIIALIIEKEVLDHQFENVEETILEAISEEKKSRSISTSSIEGSNEEDNKETSDQQGTK